MSDPEAPQSILVLKTDKVLFPDGYMELPVFAPGVAHAGAKDPVWDWVKKTGQQNGLVLVVAKRSSDSGEPYDVGTVAFLTVGSRGKGKGGSPVFSLQGVGKNKVKQLATDKDGHLVAVTEKMEEPSAADVQQFSRLRDIAVKRMEEYLDNAPVPRPFLGKLDREKEFLFMSLDITDSQTETVGKLASFLAHNSFVSTASLQKVLEMGTTRQQISGIIGLVENEILASQTRVIPSEEEHLYSTLAKEKEAEDTQQQQQKALTAKPAPKKESEGEEDEDMVKMAQKIKDTALSEAARPIVVKAFRKLARLSAGSSEAEVQRTYLEKILELPWGKQSEVNDDIKHAASILDKDHYGLERVKKEVRQYLAVQKLTKDKGKAPILCFVGPPGVGKTSIAKSIAEALGREYVREALGGVHDEAEIRGHRRTYIGAMPGRIMQGLAKAKTDNPVFVLDEIDKLSADPRHDPSAALLEVLDPEQNHAFKDTYLDIPYDLSKVMFVATANSLGGIPRALRDRMKIVELDSYIAEEKLHIARKHQIAQAMKETGLTDRQVSIEDGALHRLVNEYTHEAGVRDQKRVMVGVCSTVAEKIVSGDITSARITAANFEQYAGKPKVFQSKIAKEPEVGVANAMAFTAVGGCILPIEAVAIPAKDFSIVATGHLGEDMKESVPVAVGFILSHAKELGLSEEDLKQKVHVHALEGATPKDGPSAGVAFATVIVSALKKEKLRNDVAMTGEASMRGKVLPIGGVREKLTGAFNAGVKKVLLPEENYRRNLEDVPAGVRRGLQIEPVSTIMEAFRHAFVNGRTLFQEKANDNTAKPAAAVLPPPAPVAGVKK